MIINNNNLDSINFENDTLSFKSFIFKIKEWSEYLRLKWKFIFLSALIGGVIGISVAIIVKPTYKAILTFAMEEDKGSGVGGGGIGGALGLASSFGIDLGGGGGGAFAASNLAELMKSRLLVEKVLLKPIIILGKKTNLAEYYIQTFKLREEWAQDPNLINIHFLSESTRSKYTRQQDSILQKIHLALIDPENLSILQKDKKVTILSITVNSENELFSKLFCENLAQETSNFYIQTKSKKSRINVEVLQKQVDSVKSALNSAISGVASAVDNVYNLNPAFNLKGAPSKKKQIDVQANTAILTNLVVQLELAKITLRKETPLIQLIDSPILPLEKNKLSKLKSLILGGFLSFFVTIVYFIFLRLYKSEMGN